MGLFDEDLETKAQQLVSLYRGLGLTCASVESCTGGLVAGLITEIPGSSAVLDRGFVTYSNQAKMDLVGVPEALLIAHGAVSPEVARAMAEGAIARTEVHHAVAITGVAGPDGGTASKPVGLVHFARSSLGGATVHVEKRFGALTRSEIRRASVSQALDMLIAAAR